MPTANAEKGLTVIDQDAEQGVVEWNLDAFPTEKFNRLLPTQTLSIPTDLLRPVVQVVQLNPDPQAGDVYHSDDMPEGHYAPTKVALRKFATAAGISIVDERRVDDGRDPDVIEITCLGEMLLPTGQRIRVPGSKRIDLGAQKWSSERHRQKYKSFFQEHVSSRAENRAIRGLLSLRGSYPQATYQRPFAVVSYAPNMAHPEVRARMLDVMAGASAQLYGGSTPPAIGPGPAIEVTPAAEDDPAPGTPTQLPGESLARASGGSPEEPAWMRGAQEPAAPVQEAEPPLVERIRAVAAAGGMKGNAKDPQIETLRTIFGVLGGALTTAGLRAIWPELNVDALSANQAQALINQFRTYDSADAFGTDWRAMADAA